VEAKVRCGWRKVEPPLQAGIYVLLEPGQDQVGDAGEMIDAGVLVRLDRRGEELACDVCGELAADMIMSPATGRLSGMVRTILALTRPTPSGEARVCCLSSCTCVAT
jgi:hypothetical protein